MKNASLHFRFSSPGNWGEFVLTALYTDRDGFLQMRRYTQADIPSAQAPALANVVAALVGMGEPWQASQVWARMGTFYVPGNIPLREAETVVLTVEAVHVETGGRRMLLADDCPKFFIMDPDAVAFFKYFTEQ